MTPHAAAGEFVSRVFDANAPVDWRGIQWVANTPVGTTLDISLRTGDTPIPDATWTAFAAGPDARCAGPALTLYPVRRGARLERSEPDAGARRHHHHDRSPAGRGRGPWCAADGDQRVQNGSRRLRGHRARKPDRERHRRRCQRRAARHRGDGAESRHGRAQCTTARSPTRRRRVTAAPTRSATRSATAFELVGRVALNVTSRTTRRKRSADFYNIDEDTSLSVPAAQGILANDTDPENSALRAVLVTPPSYAASFSLSANGAFSYTPVASFAGPDIFTYKANDGDLDSAVTSVQILMNQVNDPPITEPDVFTAVLAQARSSAAPGVLANDHDIEVEDITPAARAAGGAAGQWRARPSTPTGRSPTRRIRTSSASTRSPTRRLITSTPPATSATVTINRGAQGGVGTVAESAARSRPAPVSAPAIRCRAR